MIDSTLSGNFQVYRAWSRKQGLFRMIQELVATTNNGFLACSPVATAQGPWPIIYAQVDKHHLQFSDGIAAPLPKR